MADESAPRSESRGSRGDDGRPPRTSRDSRPQRDGAQRPYVKRDGEKKPYVKHDGEKKPYVKRDGDKPYVKRDGERKPYIKRDGDKPYVKRDGDKPYVKRDGEKKPYVKRDGDKPYVKRDGDRPYAKRDGEKKPYVKRDGDRPYVKRDGDRPHVKRDGEKMPYVKRDGDRAYVKRDGDRAYAKRDGEKKPYVKRDGDRPYAAREDRSSDRPRHDDPPIPDEITPRDLDAGARNQLKTLSKENADEVARHLAMAAQLIHEDPALAHRHALAAERRAGRIAVVRETAAITAYATGDFALALRELRTYRRISGNDDQIALLVDSERGVGRPDRALEAGRAVDRSALSADVRVELAIAMSGARLDLDQPDRALIELDIPELDPDRAFPWSPGLFAARATVLEVLGRTDEAEVWQRRADVAADVLDEASGFGEDDVLEVDDLQPDDLQIAEQDSDSENPVETETETEHEPIADESAPAQREDS